MAHMCIHQMKPLCPRIVNFGNTVEHVPSMEDAHDRTWVSQLHEIFDL